MIKKFFLFILLAVILVFNPGYPSAEAAGADEGAAGTLQTDKDNAPEKADQHSRKRRSFPSRKKKAAKAKNSSAAKKEKSRKSVKDEAPEDILTKIVKKTLGRDTKILRREPPADSPVSGLKQIRIWFESVYGETPVMYYMTEDGSIYFAGSMFDADGNNLTGRDVGKTIPRVIRASDMKLMDEYRIGPVNAEVKIVLWIGTSRVSLDIFDTTYKIYEANKDKVAVYVKFYPEKNNQQDYYRTVALSCFKNDIREGFRFMSSTAPAWGQKSEDLAAFIKERHFEGCDGMPVMEDIKLAEKLNLPKFETVFINGTILIEDITKENIVRLSGVELK